MLKSSGVKFLLEEIRQNLETQDFDIVHIATHSKFSSAPEQTYSSFHHYVIVTDEKIPSLNC
ncbi:hypothetical protein H6G76_29625 [Nostoc sp. FACHB-152]|uniref:hypothetical protein n=1 Tax=unclassified Nostoc TaxID=2593658 RepID=UPI0016851D17|nr:MULTISPECIES: hypothetical protein [unclassified Nostoc]MBD2451218.1 hypothetical protein [Nostoc sp. FACHB-152]MBD2472230.1 hypothetical protein [Nostoc sp. FACHB-145]